MKAAARRVNFEFTFDFFLRVGGRWLGGWVDFENKIDANVSFQLSDGSS